jgi:hypothetical protein
MKHTRYILRIQGTKKIPDYILIAYFRLNNPTRALARCNLLDKMQEILAIASQLPYGEMRKLEF